VPGLALWDIEFEAIWLWLVVDGNNKINDRRAGRPPWTHSYVDERHSTESPIRIFYDAHFEASDLIAFLDLLDPWLVEVSTSLSWISHTAPTFPETSGV
jgi:hypothetical protein